MVSGDNDNSIILWDVATQKPLGPPLQGHSRWIDGGLVESVAFSPDGKYLASGSGDKTIILWDVATQKPLGLPLQGHSNDVTSVAFSPDGNYLASGSEDKSIILWDVATKKVLGSPLQGHSEGVESVAFSPDGKCLASGSNDGIILWDVDPQSWQRRACRIAGRNLTKQEWQSFMGNEPYRKTCSEYPSDEALALINKGERLAARIESQDIEVAIAKFKEAFSLDPLLKEHPLYSFNPETKARQIAASVLIDQGNSLAEEGNLEKAVASFKRAEELLDPSLASDGQITNEFAIALYKQRKYEEAATIFAQGLKYSSENLDLLSNDAELALVQNDLPRFQERLAKLLPHVDEEKHLIVILPFFSWLANPKQNWKAVLIAIEQHPNLTIEWDFSDLEPAIQRQEPSRQKIAQYFIDFWMEKIDLKTLKKQLGTK